MPGASDTSLAPALDRRHIAACDNCGSVDWRIYGVTLDAGALHPVQCRCRSCGLIFATPRVTPEGMRDYYRHYFSHAPGADDAQLDRLRRQSAARTLAELRPIVPSGKLLDVGSSTGAFLAEARDAGYEVTGVELSDAGVAIARERYGLDTVQATVEEAAFGDASFDVVHVWHVIEHVSDLGEFIAELHRILRPGGALVVGTESHAYPANAVLRASSFLRGRCPPAVTSTQHTFVFSAGTLADVLGRRGFEVVRVTAYDELPLRARLAATGARSRARRFAARVPIGLLEPAARLSHRGPYLRGYFRRV